MMYMLTLSVIVRNIKKKLEDSFGGLTVTVSKKADSLFPIVSAASIFAKVTRDAAIEQLQVKYSPSLSLGSGYPSDPNTVRWLKKAVDPIFGFSHELVRFSWKTIQNMSELLPVEWEDDDVDDDNPDRYDSSNDDDNDNDDVDGSFGGRKRLRKQMWSSQKNQRKITEVFHDFSVSNKETLLLKRFGLERLTSFPF